MPKGRGLGIAAHYSFVTNIATVIQVAVEGGGRIKIPRIDVAIDAAHRSTGRGARADGGAAVMGVSNTLLGRN